MDENVAYRGAKYTIQYARLRNGSVPALEFLSHQDGRWVVHINYLFKLLGDSGQIRNREKFRKFKDDIFEFKAFQIRVLCYFKPGHIVVLTHGFMKKKDDAPKQEFVLAQSIKNEYDALLKEESSRPK